MVNQGRRKLGKGGVILDAYVNSCVFIAGSHFAIVISRPPPQAPFLKSPSHSQLPAQNLLSPIRFRLPEGKNVSALFTKVRTYYVLDTVLNLRVIEMSKVWFLPSRCHTLMNKTVMHSDKQKSIWKMSQVRSILHTVACSRNRGGPTS